MILSDDVLGFKKRWVVVFGVFKSRLALIVPGCKECLEGDIKAISILQSFWLLRKQVGVHLGMILIHFW